MIQYNGSTNTGKPDPSSPYFRQNAQSSRKKGGGAAAAIWATVALAYVGISRISEGGFGYAWLIVIVCVVVAAALAAVIIAAVKRNGGATGAGVSTAASRDGHICESPAEHSASERSAASTLDEMESGYRAYSYTAAEDAAHESYVYKRIKKMTPEEYRKKLEELDSLLEAGVMTRVEYHAKRTEYARETRGM